MPSQSAHLALPRRLFYYIPGAGGPLSHPHRQADWEDAVCKEHKTVFLMQIGDYLKSGQRHDGRAPDYDDWGTQRRYILFWNETLGCSFGGLLWASVSTSSRWIASLPSQDATIAENLPVPQNAPSGHLPSP